MPSVDLGGSVKTRLIASVALGAAVLLGTTGCNLIAPQATTIEYSASDGVNVPESAGPLAVRNALIVANGDGTVGNFVAAIVNNTTSSQTLRLEVGEGSSAVQSSVVVPASTTLSLGDLSDDVEPLRLDDIDAVPGTTVPVYFQSGDGEGALIEVPVLDGGLEYLAPLAPTAEPSITIKPTPSGTSAVTPTPTASPSS
ncbi:DNA modification methylase [Microbacterium testaceum]|uniref:DNA modification methylase n=1 Tax=Microbacterium testaceum TaxID=2033 RepID=UPI001FAFE46C|nr:DNA modification methylase [Microbacterium testaceum]